ncbi:unnamed protein product, partial [Meganyctiphanes norvegica]
AAECSAGGSGRRKRHVNEIEGRKRHVNEIEAENQRKVCLNDNKYWRECNEVVTDIVADQKLLYTACLFDLCIVTTYPEVGITKDEMLEQHQEIVAVARVEEENTIDFSNFVSSERKCPAGWSPVGGICGKYHRFKEGMGLNTVLQQCLADNATLADPR